jgi:hypothetical protein
MRRIIGITLATAIAGSAMAAEPPVTPPPILTYNWTGIYLGINGGGAWGQQDPFNILTNQYSNEPVRSRFHQFQWWNGRRDGWRSNTARSCRLGLRDGPRLGRHQRFVGSHAINFRRPGRLHGQCNDQRQLGSDRKDTPRICLGQLLVLCDCRLSCSWRQDEFEHAQRIALRFTWRYRRPSWRT